MQIRYQNVQKIITYMSVSFAFMKKVLESAHPSFSSFDTTMNSELKRYSKNSKNMVAKNKKCSKCLPSFIRERHSWKSWQKNNLFWSVDCFFLPRHPRMIFLDETWQALKTFVILCHHFFKKN